MGSDCWEVFCVAADEEGVSGCDDECGCDSGGVAAGRALLGLGQKLQVVLVSPRHPDI